MVDSELTGFQEVGVVVVVDLWAALLVEGVALLILEVLWMKARLPLLLLPPLVGAVLLHLLVVLGAENSDQVRLCGNRLLQLS